MDIELRNTTGPESENDRNAVFGGRNGDAPARSSLRLQYEAQTQVIRKQTGDLESIRLKLGLSARKICQLLLVDPSAWTRWTKAGGDAPPHIYRALQWYLSLQDKIPGLNADYFIGRNVAVENAGLKRDLDLKYAALEKGQQVWSESQKRELQSMQVSLAEAGMKESTLRAQIQGLEGQVRRLVLVQGILGGCLIATLLFAAIKLLF